MFCTKCGTRVDQGDNYCKNCGVRIERRGTAASSAAAAAGAAAASAPKPQAPAQPSGGASTPDRKAGTTRKALIGAVGIVVLALSATGLYFGRGASKAVSEPALSSQREEAPAAKILHTEAFASSEETRELGVPADSRLASMQRSEIVEAPRIAELSKAGADVPPLLNSQTKASGQKFNRNSRPAPEPASRGGAKAGVYETVQSTTVYEDPSASATIVADIPAGVRVNVVSGSGDWLEVHSRRGNPPGFIRRADAVFVESSN